MNYNSKAELFKRFCDDFHAVTQKQVEGYDQLLANLRDSGKRRNLVAHADWESVDEDEDGYTYVRLSISNNGMNQEYMQFSKDSLRKIINLIYDTRTNLGEHWECTMLRATQQISTTPPQNKPLY